MVLMSNHLQQSSEQTTHVLEMVKSWWNVERGEWKKRHEVQLLFPEGSAAALYAQNIWQLFLEDLGEDLWILRPNK